MGNPISLKLDGVVCARCHREIASIPMNVFVVRRQKHGYEMVPVTAIGCVRAMSKGLEYELDCRTAQCHRCGAATARHRVLGLSDQAAQRANVRCQPPSLAVRAAPARHGIDPLRTKQSPRFLAGFAPRRHTQTNLMPVTRQPSSRAAESGPAPRR